MPDPSCALGEAVALRAVRRYDRLAATAPLS